MSTFYDIPEEAAASLERLAALHGRKPLDELAALISDNAKEEQIEEKDTNGNYISLFECESKILMDEYGAESLAELYDEMASEANEAVRKDIITLIRAAAHSATTGKGEAAEKANRAIEGIITALCDEIGDTRTAAN